MRRPLASISPPAVLSAQPRPARALSESALKRQHLSRTPGGYTAGPRGRRRAADRPSSPACDRGRGRLCRSAAQAEFRRAARGGPHLDVAVSLGHETCVRTCGASFVRPSGVLALHIPRSTLHMPRGTLGDPRRCPSPQAQLSAPSGLLHEYIGQKRRKCPKKACLEFVAAPQPARAAGTHRSRVRHTQWTPPSVPNQLESAGSTPCSLWGCNKLAAERATDGVPAEVMECET